MIQMKSGGRLVLTSDTRSIVHRGEGAIRVFHCGTNIGNTKYDRCGWVPKGVVVSGWHMNDLFITLKPCYGHCND